MADLIDRASLMRRVEKWLPRDKCGEETLEDSILTDLCVSMLMEVEEQPTVDAVQVVRCKDCKKRCTNMCGKRHEVADMDFCNNGERKDGTE